MTNIKRYNFTINGVVETDDGNYVLYDDHEAMLEAIGAGGVSSERITQQTKSLEQFPAVTQPWQPPETAPKDQVFIGDFGMPWPLAAQWNGANGKFVTAQAAVDMFGGVYNDTYFESEWLEVGELKAWMPLPEIDNE